VKGYSGAVHKSYTTEEAANTAWQEFSKESAPPRPPVNSFTWSPSPPNLDISEDDEEPPLKKVKLSPEHGCSSQGSAGSIPFGNDEQQFKHEEPVKITPAQQAVVDMAQEGHNIFLTGAAGCGKTVTLKEIIRCLRKRFGNASFEHPSVQVIAPTGIAALPLDGKTTYSFAGWKPDSLQQPIEDLLEAAESKQSIQTRFHSLKVLIIEEVSMVENEFLERINLLMQHVLKSSKPFGGKQIILVGDFHQLPPIKPFQFCLICGNQMTKSANYFCVSDLCRSKTNQAVFKSGDKWAFKASVWTELNLRYVKLEQIHRQKDARFQNILNKVRNGVLLSVEEWTALKDKKNLPRGAFAVRLMSRRNKVIEFNLRKLETLRTQEESWHAVDSCSKLNGSPEDQHYPRKAEILETKEEYKRSLKDHRLSTELTLRVGAHVVLLSNLSPKAGLVNGSQGEVIGFVDTGKWTESEENKTNTQRYENEKLKNPLRPIVRFTNGQTKTIHSISQESSKGTPRDRYLLCRTQIPLTLGWALSIHKSQGMTLENVEVSSNDIFESGQLYVGLSRATTLDGLTVTGFSQEQLILDEDVLEFYRDAKWESLGPSNISQLVKVETKSDDPNA